MITTYRSDVPGLLTGRLVKPLPTTSRTANGCFGGTYFGTATARFGGQQSFCQGDAWPGFRDYFQHREAPRHKIKARLAPGCDSLRQMDALTAFGLLSVTAMLLCYALEERSPWFILAFAASCALGSVYGFLQGAWPFGLVESIWAAVAVRRWHKAQDRDKR